MGWCLFQIDYVYITVFPNQNNIASVGGNQQALDPHSQLPAGELGPALVVKHDLTKVFFVITPGAGNNLTTVGRK